MAAILVVEDDIFMLESLEWVFEGMGHCALPASNLAGALAHLVAVQPIHALFVDIRLDVHVFGGYDVANQAIGLRPNLPVLYTSGCPLTQDMTGRFVPGGDSYRSPIRRPD